MLASLWPRCTVPTDLDEVTSVRAGAEVDARSVGVDPQGVERIWQAVERLYASGHHPAATLCLRRRGQVLIDRAIGHSAGNAPEDPPHAVKLLARPDTPFCVLSASKSITAMLLHLMDERDLLRLDDPVCEFIPEFARFGKEAITIRHVLSHRAGVPNPPPDTMDPELLAEPARIVELLCDQKPLWRPGKQLAYHAVTTGFLLGEIVRRVTGRDIRAYLDEVLRRPLGFRWMSYGVAPEDVRQVAVNALTGPMPLPPISTLFTRALGLDVQAVVRITNDPRFLTSIFPSGNVVATADELCRFFELLRRGGELDGARIFDRRTVVRAVSEQSYLEPDFTLMLPFRYSMGFMLGAEWFSLYGPHTRHAFGHIGFTNVIGWADPDRDVSGALLTSGKPLLYPEIYYVLEMLRQIVAACPEDGVGIGAGSTATTGRRFDSRADVG